MAPQKKILGCSANEKAISRQKVQDFINDNCKYLHITNSQQPTLKVERIIEARNPNNIKHSEQPTLNVNRILEVKKKKKEVNINPSSQESVKKGFRLVECNISGETLTIKDHFIKNCDIVQFIHSDQPTMGIFDDSVDPQTDLEVDLDSIGMIEDISIEQLDTLTTTHSEAGDFKIEILALKLYREFIEKNFPDIQGVKFKSMFLLEGLSKKIREIIGNVPYKKIAEILYGTSHGSEGSKFAVLRHNKIKVNSLIDEDLVDSWLSNLKNEFPDQSLFFSKLINNYKLLCAEKRVFDLVSKWDSYNNKVLSRGLKLETKKNDFVKSALKGTLIEDMIFELSCEVPSHDKIFVSYKYLLRAVCPLCSRIEKSYSYKDLVKEAESRDARFGLSESEFSNRINGEFKKSRTK